jgi:hemerythrin
MGDCQIIAWSDLYLLGDEQIDSEHKKLFELAADIQNSDEDITVLKGAIKELVKYTKFHFASEERYMRYIDYVDLSRHIEIHKKIVKDLHTIIHNLPNESLTQTRSKIIDFMNNGLVHHIMIEDKKVQHFRKNRLGIRNLFKWEEKYKVHNDMIDDDHKRLFELALNTLNYKTAPNKKEFVRSTIIELNKYMKEHFEREEDYMHTIAFPLYKEHKELHQKIIDQINSLIKQLPKLSFEEFEIKIVSYIDIWLVNHIIQEDQKIICYKDMYEEETPIDLESITPHM